MYRRGTEDLSILNFERHKWGGVRHGNPKYAYLDLSLFVRTDLFDETERDVDILNRILDAARCASPNAHPRDLERAISKALPSNAAERAQLLGILAMCGILASDDHPGQLQRWVSYRDRQPPPQPSRNDWLYPMFWWRGSFGINENAAREVFGDRVR